MQQIVAGHVRKMVSSYRPSLFRDSLRRILAIPQAPQCRVLPWHNEVYNCIKFNLLPTLQSHGISDPHHGYEEPPPWEPPQATFLTNSLAKAKAKYSLNDLRNCGIPFLPWRMMKTLLLSTQKDLLIQSQAELEVHFFVTVIYRHRGSVMDAQFYRRPCILRLGVRTSGRDVLSGI